MLLLTKKDRKALPELYANENLAAEEAVAVVKFFSPEGSWKFFATEFDGKDTFFGLVVGQFTELGYVSLSEMKAVRTPTFRLPIERDLHFSPTSVAELKKQNPSY